MHKVRLTAACLVLTALVAAGCAPAKAPARQEVPEGYRSVRMIGSSIGGAATTAVMGISAVLNKHYPEIEWSSSSGATGTNAIYLTNGTIKVGQTGASAYIDAYGFDKVAQSRLRSITPDMALNEFIWVIPEDKPWKDLTEVPKGATVSPGTPASVTTIVAEAWLKLVGLNKKDFNWVPLGKQELADAWRASKLDVAFISVVGPAPYMSDMQSSPKKFKPMGLSPDQAARAKVEQTFERLGGEPPAMTKVTQLVPDVFKYDVMAVQQAMMLSSRDDFPDSVAYKMAKTLDEHHDELVRIYSVLKWAAPEWHIKWPRAPIDIHPGVARYYREKAYLK